MTNKDQIISLCFELNSLLKNEFDLSIVKNKIKELVSYFDKNSNEIINNPQYLSLIKKINSISDLSEELENVFFNILPLGKTRYIKEKIKYEIFRVCAKRNNKILKRYLLKNEINYLYNLIEYENKYRLENIEYLKSLYSVLKIKARTQNKEDLLDNFYDKFGVQKDKGFIKLKLYLLNKIIRLKLNNKEKEKLFISVAGTSIIKLIKKIILLKNINQDLVILSIIEETSSENMFYSMNILMSNIDISSNSKEKVKILLSYLNYENIEKIEKQYNKKIDKILINRKITKYEEEIKLLIEEIKLKNQLKNF